MGHSAGRAQGFRQMSGSVSPRSDDGDDEESPARANRPKPTRLSHSKQSIDNMLKELSLTSPEAIETGTPSKHQQQQRRQQFDTSSPRTSNYKEQLEERIKKHQRTRSDGSVNVHQIKKEVCIENSFVLWSEFYVTRLIINY